MFDIGFLELALLFVIGLVVLGPERLPRAVRTLGGYLRKARQTWYRLRSEIEEELANEDIKRNFTEPVNELRNSVNKPLEQARKDLHRPVSELKDELSRPVETAPTPEPPADDQQQATPDESSRD